MEERAQSAALSVKPFCVRRKEDSLGAEALEGASTVTGRPGEGTAGTVFQLRLYVTPIRPTHAPLL